MATTRSILLPALVALAVAVAVGLVADVVAQRMQSEDTRAMALAQNGKPAEAEETLWRLLGAGPITVSRTIAFLDAHAMASAPIVLAGDDDDENAFAMPTRSSKGPSVAEEAIDGFFARGDLPGDVALLGRYWWRVRQRAVDDTTRAAVAAAADATPPMPWANRLLAREPRRGGSLAETARRLAREGAFVPEHADDANQGLGILAETGDWQTMGELLADPRIARVASPATKSRYAVEVNDWKAVVRWAALSPYQHPGLGPLLLAAIAALAWGAFCVRLGKARERPLFRGLLYIAAFALGTLSVAITDVLILVEESKLRLVATGDAGRDILFFTFGVGFREEISKLALFAPLVPILRRKGSKLDVLVCGALVGLGFAAMENLGYLQMGDMTTGIARFLTANFLHMSMTAILASALHDFARDSERYANDMSRTALIVMGLHGAYDFCIEHPEIGGGYLSMGVFFVLTGQFLAAVDFARGRSEPGYGLLRTFVMGIAVVCGATFVWASIVAGPGIAAHALVQGFLGNAIITYVFVRQLRAM